MALHTFAPALAYDQAARRGVGGVVAKVTDLETGVPVETYDVNGDPRPVITNAQGYIAPFFTDDTVQAVMLTIGGHSLPLTAQEMIGAGVDAAVAAQVAAEAAAQLVDAPADTVVKTLVSGPTQTQAALDGRYTTPAQNDAKYASKATATSSAAGLMAAADKAMLDAANANNVAGTLVRRNANGNFNVATPTGTGHAVPKSYVDGQVATTVRKDELSVNVRDYGAKGDGTTDDTAAFIAAVSAIPASGGTLLIPAGRYVINSQVRLKDGVQVSGYGATIIKTGPGYLVFVTSSQGAKGYGSSAKGISIRGLTYESNFAGNQALVNAFHHAMDVTIEDCVFNGATRDGHCFDLIGCKRVTFRRCIFRGSLESPGRKYCEAVQIDHSARSNAGSELVEDSNSWDGLPTVGVTMEDCHAEPLTVGGTTYKAPRLIGAHSRIETFRHKNIKIVRCNVTDSGTTVEDGQYQGWIHFIHAENVTIDSCDFINTHSTVATAIGFQAVTNTYPLSSVAESSPATNNAAGSVACADVKIIGCTFTGFNNPTNEDVIKVFGVASAVAKRFTITDPIFTDCHPGASSSDHTLGATCVRAQYAEAVEVNNPQADLVRMVLSAANSTDASLNGGRSSRVIRIVFHADIVSGVTLRGHKVKEGNGLTYCTSSSGVLVEANNFRSAYTGSVPYANAIGINDCVGAAVNGNYLDTVGSSQLTRGVYFQGATSKGAANANTCFGFTTGVQVQSGAAATIANTVTS